MESKKINRILIVVSVVLTVAFGGCLFFSLRNPRFNFVNTISSISSFFVAILTIIYVYTTSKQMDFMKQQLAQMQQDQRTREQPILDLEPVEFKIERPKFYYSPPIDEYSYLARHFFSVRINNVSNYPAVFVDISAQLVISENECELCLDTTSRRINIISSNSISKEIKVMFAHDSQHKMMSALRSDLTSNLPKLKISILYKSLSGANYLLTHTYWIDIAEDDEQSFEILKSWHTALVSAPIEEKEMLEQLKKILDEETQNSLFYIAREAFDKKLIGADALRLHMVEIPQAFSLKTISDDEFNLEIESHQYGHYVGSRINGCDILPSEEPSVAANKNMMNDRLSS